MHFTNVDRGKQRVLKQSRIGLEVHFGVQQGERVPA
jgi:hypothetical protein